MLRFNFKNDKERRRFLQEYEKWGIWFIEPHTNVTFYRCQLPSGHFIVVEKQPDRIISFCNMTCPIKRERYHIYRKSYDLNESRITEIMEILHCFRGIYNIDTAEDLETDVLNFIKEETKCQ